MAKAEKIKLKMSGGAIFRVLLGVALVVAAILVSSCTESQKRGLKSIQSNWGGGINRTLVLMDYEGDTLKVWSGRFDVRDSGSDNQIFFDLDGKRVWIQGGIVVSEEK